MQQIEFTAPLSFRAKHQVRELLASCDKIVCGAHVGVIKWKLKSGHYAEAALDSVLVSLDRSSEARGDFLGSLMRLPDVVGSLERVDAALELLPLSGEREWSLLRLDKLSRDRNRHIYLWAEINGLSGGNGWSVFPNNLVRLASEQMCADLDENTLIQEDPLFVNQKEYFKRMNVVRAWCHEKGSSEVRVGVVDGGIWSSHIDLRTNIRGDLARDYVQAKSGSVGFSEHGTVLAGIIGADADGGNKVGIRGVCKEVSVISLRAFDGGCSSEDIIVKAIAGAAGKDVGVGIVVAAWWGLGEFSCLKEKIREVERSLLIVTAASNSYHDLESVAVFPGSSKLGNVLTVTGLDSKWGPNKSYGYGSSRVHIHAPSESIRSTGIDYLQTGYSSAYPFSSGTSTATALVAGVAALVKATSVGKLMSPEQIKARIIKSSDYMKVLEGYSCSAGIVNAERAVTGKDLRKVSGY